MKRVYKNRYVITGPKEGTKEYEELLNELRRTRAIVITEKEEPPIKGALFVVVVVRGGFIVCPTLPKHM